MRPLRNEMRPQREATSFKNQQNTEEKIQENKCYSLLHSNVYFPANKVVFSGMK